MFGLESKQIHRSRSTRCEQFSQKDQWDCQDMEDRGVSFLLTLGLERWWWTGPSGSRDEGVRSSSVDRTGTEDSDVDVLVVPSVNPGDEWQRDPTSTVLDKGLLTPPIIGRCDSLFSVS